MPGLVFSRSQSVVSQASSDRTEEYVEDSEPEREERRLKEKSRRKKTRSNVRPRPVAEVIELSDSGTSSAPISRRRPAKTADNPVIIVDDSGASDDFASSPREHEEGSQHGGLGDALSAGTGEETLDETLPSIREILGLPKAPSPPVIPRGASTKTPAETASETPPRLPKDPEPLSSSLTTAESGEGDQRSLELTALPDTSVDETLPSIRKILGLPKAAPAVPPNGTAKIIAGQAPVARPLHLSSAEPLSSATPTGALEEENQGPLKLARFAYTDPKAGRRSISKTPSSSERDSSTPEVPLPAKSKRLVTPPSHAYAQDFTDAELSRIRKCVSCETSWTVRKSVANKMKHIEVCARKKKLTHETIRVLLQKELDNLPPVASTSKLPSADSAPALPETLLEEAVKDVQKKKAGRRPQVLQTVKSVQETRSNILDRARLLLQDTRNMANSAAGAAPASPPNVEMPPPTQVFGVSKVAPRSTPSEADAAETTQVFGRSRLGRAQVTRAQTGIVRTGADIAANSEVSPLTQVFGTSALGAGPSCARHVSADLDDAPPATQVFAPSKFTNARTVTEAMATTTYDDPLDEPISLHDTSEDEERGQSSPRPIVISSSPSSNANRLPRSPSPANAARSPAPTPFARTPSPARRRRSPSPTGEEDLPDADVDAGYEEDDYYYEQDWNNWNDGFDNACLHYIPDENGAGPSNPSPRTQLQDSAPAPRRLGAILEDLPITGSNTGEQAPPPEPPKKRTRRKKAAAAEDGDTQAQAGVGKDISQEDLNAKLKEAILKDETLHLRVLRYEPIHFDVFMKLATDLGIPAKRSGLKLKVRTFLDQKAIHFYGADPSKSRTRRTRHP